jgi:hypothetical protein
MSTKFYKYVYGRQNYRRYNRDLMLANDCTIESQTKQIEEQTREWREWRELERLHREYPEDYPPPPPPPLNFDPGVVPPINQLLCKQAYARVVKKQELNPNSNIMSINMRIGYWMTHQNRLPLITAWY